MLRVGLSVRVWTGAQACFQTPEAVQAVNTASRDLPGDEAASAVASTVGALGRDERTLFFKKIDSTLRGPIAAELNAAQQALGIRAILFAPSFPAAGRTVRDGRVHIGDISGRRDWLDIRGALAEMKGQVAYLASADELAPALEQGKTLLVCDSGTQVELDAWARAAQPVPGLLYAGSAGLAEAVAALYGSPADAERIPEAERTLVVCGTLHAVTKLQLEHLNRAQFAAAEVICIRCESGDAERVRSTFETLRPHALVLTGGDTALLALRALGVHSLVLRGACAAGIPWAVAQGGAADGCTVVTKSGGFGCVSALSDILAMLDSSNAGRTV